MMMFLLRTNILVSRWGQQTKSGHLFLSDISWQRTFLSFQTTFEQQKVPVNLSLEECFRHSDLLLLVLTITIIFLLNYSDGNCARICDLWELSSVHLVWSVVCCEVLRVIVIVILKSVGRVGTTTLTTQSHHNESSNNNNNTHHSRLVSRT